jgi:hypothetical protein
MVPGMTIAAVVSLDDFDALTSLVRWVEQGDAPNAFVAKGKAFPVWSGRSAPIRQWRVTMARDR